MDKKIVGTNMKRTLNLIIYFILAGLLAVAFINYTDNREQDEKFQSVGSRFTGEDMIWILQNSNIQVKGKDIPGAETPFRDYIRN